MAESIVYTDEQAKVINHCGSDLLVSASAGSGKTFVMIEKIIELITTKNVSVSEILAVTFTKAAASEMKEKLKKAVMDKYREKPSEWLKEQMRLIPSADVCTIHSFCGNLLRQYFFEAGIDSNFSVMEESETLRLKNRVIDELFEDRYSLKDENFLKLTSTYLKSRRDYNLKQIIINAYNYFIGYYGFENKAKQFFNVYTPEGYDELILKEKQRFSEGYADYFEEFCKISEDFKLAKLEKSENYIKDNILPFLQTKINNNENNHFLPQFPPVPRIPKECDYKDVQEAFKNTKRDLIEFCKKEESLFAEKEQNYKDMKNAEIQSQGIFNLLLEFKARYEKEKTEEAKVDFDDLINYALRLMENKDVAESVSHKYSFVFADEYQDVNESQELLIKAISRDNAFMVGDLKQSIYSFRGCNPKFFEEKYRQFSECGNKSMTLNGNFRCAEGIINGVNALFSGIMTENTCECDYKGKAKLIFAANYPKGYGEIICHEITDDSVGEERELQIYDLKKEKEKAVNTVANAQAEVIKKIITENVGGQHFDIKKGVFVKTCFRDIAILSRNNKSLKGIYSALTSSGIPATCESGTNLFDYPEIAFIVNLFEYIACSEEDVPLTAVMKSVIGNFNENELVAIRLGGEKFVDVPKRDAPFCKCARAYCQNYDDVIADKLKQFYSWTDKIRLFSEFASAYDVFLRINEEFGLETELLSHSGGKYKIERIYLLLGQSTGINDALKVKEFLKKIEELKTNMKVTDSGGEDAVTLVTMHKSKGLEYPIVIIPDLQTQYNTDDFKKPVYFDEEYGIVTKAYDLDTMTSRDTLLRDYVKYKKTATLRKEEMRLLYVAMTRAKCKLHLISEKGFSYSLSERLIKSATRHSELIPYGLYNLAIYNLSDLKSSHQNKGYKNIVLPCDKNLSEKLAKVLYKPYRYESSLNIASKYTVTQLSEKEREKDAVIKVVAPMSDFSVNDYYGENYVDKPSAERGTAYHAFLKYADFSLKKVSDIEKEISEFVDKKYISINQSELIDAKNLSQILLMPIFDKYIDYKRYSEKEFICSISAKEAGIAQSDDEIIIQGIIDLLLIKGNSAVIIDYKYSSHTDENYLKETYAVQLNMYKRAVEKLLHLNVVETLLVNIYGHNVIKI